MNEARHSFLSQSISPLQGGTPAPNDLPLSFHWLRIKVDTGNNTHLFSVYLVQTKMQSAVDLSHELRTHSATGGEITVEPSGHFPISFSDRIRYHKHIRHVYETESSGKKNVEIERKYGSKQEKARLRGRAAVAWQRLPLQIIA